MRFLLKFCIIGIGSQQFLYKRIGHVQSINSSACCRAINSDSKALNSIVCESPSVCDNENFRKMRRAKDLKICTSASFMDNAVGH